MDLTDFQQKLKDISRPVIVDIWAPWCGPCRMIEPALHHLEQEYDGRVDVLKINSDEHFELVQALNVSGVPTLLVFRDGQEITRLTGFQPRPVLNSLFETALSGEAPQRKWTARWDCLLRLSMGLGLALATWIWNLSSLYYLVSLFVIYSIIHDRCPIWQDISRQFRRLVEKIQPPAASSE
jgi:thioredoxin 1